MNAPAYFAPAGTHFYRNGELCAYTGDVETLHGAPCYSARIVADSHRVGTLLFTFKAPATVCR